MNLIFTKEVVTRKVFRLSVVLTGIMFIWHATLLGSNAPYVNSYVGWFITFTTPFLACIGIHAIIIMYKNWFGSKASGEAIQAGGGDLFLNISGHAIEAFIAVVVFVVFLPIILFALPSGIVVGIAYHKQNIWQTIVSNLHEYSSWEQIFVGVVSIFVALALAVIIWENIIIAYNVIIKIFKWALK